MNAIAKLNDAYRQAGPTDQSWTFTRSVADRGLGFQITAVHMVRRFDAFTPENDPYGEHDFGSFEIEGQKLFWKIDCYDASDMTTESPDPADPEVTRRVLTIMLASEY